MDKKKALALEQWKEDHNGSSEGFYEEWSSLTKDDYLQMWEDRFDSDTADLY